MVAGESYIFCSSTKEEGLYYTYNTSEAATPQGFEQMRWLFLKHFILLRYQSSFYFGNEWLINQCYLKQMYDKSSRIALSESVIKN